MTTLAPMTGLGAAAANPLQPPPLTPVPHQQGPAQQLKDQWGIEIVGLRLSAADYMLDFRYRVLEPAKAGALLKRTQRPHIVDQATGAKFLVPNPPKIGPLRQTGRVVAGRTYFTLFANPGRRLKRGDKVTFVLGDITIENLVVQ